MPVTFVTLVVAALAVWEIIEIWRHSALLSGLRARTELWENKIGQALHCAFCLSPWMAWLVCLTLFVPVPAEDGPATAWGVVTAVVVGFAQFVVLGFAVARLANLGNDLTRAYCRTPNRTAPKDASIQIPPAEAEGLQLD